MGSQVKDSFMEYSLCNIPKEESIFNVTIAHQIFHVESCGRLHMGFSIRNIPYGIFDIEYSVWNIHMESFMDISCKSHAAMAQYYPHDAQSFAIVVVISRFFGRAFSKFHPQLWGVCGEGVWRGWRCRRRQPHVAWAPTRGALWIRYGGPDKDLIDHLRQLFC